jgi:hypothetical protein
MPKDTDVDAEEMTTDEAVQAALAYDGQRRLWLKALVPLAQWRPDEYDNPGPRVEHAIDRMRVAVLERIARICQSDLGPDQRPAA